MKHSISLIIVLLFAFILLTGCSTSNAEFELRDGIHFGDDLATVKSKETQMLKEDSISRTDMISYNGVIVGREATTTYDFDDNTGGLIDMDYHYSESILSNDEIADDQYTTLYQALEEKYGKPLDATEENPYPITGNAISTAQLYIDLTKAMGKYTFGYYSEHNEWVVKSNGYYVKIDLLKYYTGVAGWSSNTIWNMIDLSYHYLNNEDYESAIRIWAEQKNTEKQMEIEAEEAIENDI